MAARVVQFALGVQGVNLQSAAVAQAVLAEDFGQAIGHDVAANVVKRAGNVQTPRRQGIGIVHADLDAGAGLGGAGRLCLCACCRCSLRAMGVCCGMGIIGIA